MIRETDHFLLEVQTFQDTSTYAIVNKATEVVEGRGISLAEMSQAMDKMDADLSTELIRVEKRIKFKLVH